jgi:hypothetical protein
MYFRITFSLVEVNYFRGRRIFMIFYSARDIRASIQLALQKNVLHQQQNSSSSQELRIVICAADLHFKWSTYWNTTTFSPATSSLIGPRTWVAAA